MNQEAIGKFIAACRKEQNLTQMQLAEKLNITNRASNKQLAYKVQNRPAIHIWTDDFAIV